MDIVSEWYIEGIKEGRSAFETYPDLKPDEEIANIKQTMRGFGARSPVGQMLRGELDFWMNRK